MSSNAIPVIVSRHEAAIDYCTSYILAERPGCNIRVLRGNVTAEDIRGCEVYGNIPLHLAAEAAVIAAVEFAGAPPRGAELSAAEMEAAGARITRYRVIRE